MDATAEAMVARIKHCGYRVFMCPPSNTYCYYTDGTRIGYAQWGQTTRVTTVHKANTTTGTGFIISDEITPATLREALITHAPTWAASWDRASIHKYKDWAAFRAADPWHDQLQEM